MNAWYFSETHESHHNFHWYWKLYFLKLSVMRHYMTCIIIMVFISCSSASYIAKLTPLHATISSHAAALCSPLMQLIKLHEFFCIWTPAGSIASYMYIGKSLGRREYLTSKVHKIKLFTKYMQWSSDIATHNTALITPCHVLYAPINVLLQVPPHKQRVGIWAILQNPNFLSPGANVMIKCPH